MPIETVDVGDLWSGALLRAVSSGHSPYDTLFVELAVRLGTSVASYDQQLQSRFKTHVGPPSEFLAR